MDRLHSLQPCLFAADIPGPIKISSPGILLGLRSGSAQVQKSCGTGVDFFLTLSIAV